MGNKKPTYNYAKSKLENKKNDEADFSVEFGKENTFDQINLTQNENSLKNKPEKSKPQEEEFGQDQDMKKNNRQFVSRNKKNDREGKNNRGNDK